jgi:hypothetical protein
MSIVFENFRILLRPGQTPRIVKPDLVRAVRRIGFLCAALYIRCAVFTVATPTVRAVLGLRAVVVCSARFGRAEQQGAPADHVPASPRHTRTMRGLG